MSEKTAVGGPWTRHGHLIPGVTVAGSGRPPVARCGGRRMCHACALDAARVSPRPPAPALPADVIEAVARELANHQGLRGPMDDERPDVWQNRCDCGWDDGDERPGWRDRYRLHVAAAAIAAMPPTPAEARHDTEARR
ncbi:MAG: hypothetical protein JWM36_4889 [Hyphomicrobiales bacterium]|nr:hypothetical protein [Hyphomicrobiales bacterium]